VSNRAPKARTIELFPGQACSNERTPKMPKVVQIIYSGMGGHGSVAFSLIDADSNGEWNPIMGFFGIEPLSPAYAAICRSRGISYEYFGAHSGKSWRAWPRIFCWLTDTRPEAIVLHSVTALLPCKLYAYLRKAPLIVVEHQANALKRPSEWMFSRLAMLLADRVVVLTPAYNQELKDRLGLFYRAGKVCIIPNGIDLSRFSPHVHSVNRGGSVRLGMAARFTSIKRQDVLIDMMVELRSREPGIEWHLSLAGDGEGWESIDRKVRAKGLEAYVSLPGQLGEDRLIEWYREIDFYLHASEGETLSTALLQAMASALPIVASDVPGIRSLVSGETNCGVLVERQSPQGFAESVIRLIEEPKAAANLGKAGRELIEKHYSHNYMFTNYKSLLKNHA
jgi:glycosyltransferase involved in cell wall biosynthesis